MQSALSLEQSCLYGGSSDLGHHTVLQKRVLEMGQKEPSLEQSSAIQDDGNTGINLQTSTFTKTKKMHQNGIFWPLAIK